MRSHFQTTEPLPLPHTCFKLLTLVYNCVKDILELICTDLHVVTSYLLENAAKLLLFLTFVVCVARPWL